MRVALDLIVYPAKSNKLLFFMFPTTAELSYGSVESESDYYEWKNENWTEKNESEESWEDEVDKLVAWTSALDVGALDYEN